PTALYGLFEVFAAVAVTWSQLTGEAAPARRIAARIVARDRAVFASPLGTPIQPQAALDEVPRSDLVIVTDLALPGDAEPRGRWPAETAWVRAQHAAGATLCSICTGSLFLAGTGLLDGLEATTHWSATGLFASCF